MKKQYQTLLAISLILAVLLCSIPAWAAVRNQGDGWISITIGEESSEFDREGIGLSVYLIAKGEYGEWTMLDAFSDIKVFTRNDGSASVDTALSKIEKRIREQGIKANQTQKSDEKGKAEFKDLAHGIYFVMMAEQPELLKIGSMLIAVPDKKGSLKVRVNAKYEYETPTPSPTPTPKPTATPFAPVDTPTAPYDTAPPTATPVATPSPTPDPDSTPIPVIPPTLPPDPMETPVIIEDYETALGLGNIQMHVGVCFE